MKWLIVLGLVGCHDQDARRREENAAYRCGRQGGEWQSGTGGFRGRCGYLINDRGMIVIPVSDGRTLTQCVQCVVDEGNTP